MMLESNEYKEIKPSVLAEVLCWFSIKRPDLFLVCSLQREESGWPDRQ
jgi:hypothetical protein